MWAECEEVGGTSVLPQKGEGRACSRNTDTDPSPLAALNRDIA
jgi:hypothetical protein